MVPGLGSTSPHPRNSTEKKSAAEAKQDSDYYYPYRALRDWFTKDAAGFFTFWLFVIGGSQIGLFYVQLRLIRDSLNPAKDAAKAALESSEHVRKTERAYVGMSHLGDEEWPGLNPANRKIRIEIKNAGNTPARVLGVRMGWFTIAKDEAVPDKPPYERTVEVPGAEAFLHTGAPFYVRFGLDAAEQIAPDEWAAVTTDSKTLYVIGLVEYIDVFDAWHRATYARRYTHDRKLNNLAFVHARGYSEDIDIRPAERLTGQQTNQ